MPTTLLPTKLHPPQARPGLVRRPRLTGILAQGTFGPLTLVSAPAGSGKTTLMAEQLAAAKSRSPISWVSLDPADNDPLRFLAYLTAAIEAALPGLIRSTVDEVASRVPFLEISRVPSGRARVPS
jgi:LuxR family transcriptional regulator, maltose regulon positive regulatory protein